MSDDDMKKSEDGKIVLEESRWMRVATSMWFWGAVVVVVCVFFPLVVPKLVNIGGTNGQIPADYWTKRGIFGDQYGMLNALFSGLAFAGVITALYFQRKEIELQREELRLQREEMRLQREEMETATAEQARHRVVFEMQQKEAERQRFESSFNSFVGLMYERKRSVYFENKHDVEAIMDMFNDIRRRLISVLSFCHRSGIVWNPDHVRTLGTDEGIIHYDTSIWIASRMCRGWCISWAMCVIHVEKSLLEQDEKKVYFSYLRDILSPEESDMMILCFKVWESGLLQEARSICEKNEILVFNEKGEEWWEK